RPGDADPVAPARLRAAAKMAPSPVAATRVPSLGTELSARSPRAATQAPLPARETPVHSPDPATQDRSARARAPVATPSARAPGKFTACRFNLRLSPAPGGLPRVNPRARAIR